MRRSGGRVNGAQRSVIANFLGCFVDEMVSSHSPAGRKSVTLEISIAIEQKREETAVQITTVGLDLAKNVFHAAGFDARGREAKKRMPRHARVRGDFKRRMRRQPRGVESTTLEKSLLKESAPRKVP